MEDQFLSLIEESDKILISSHISPDPDAVTSVLLLGRILMENFPSKDIQLILEEKPTEDLSFLAEYSLIKHRPILETLQSFKPQLFIIVDANSYERVSRTEGPQVRQFVNEIKAKTAVIDHHELDDKDKPDILINNKRPATAEEIYSVCFDLLQLKKPADYAETALLGIISDTQRHRFDHPGHRETYRIVSDLLDAGASIEKLEARLEHFNKNELDVIGHLAGNIKDSGKGYSFSYIDDSYYQDWLEAGKPTTDMKNGVEMFTNYFIKNFEGNKWGFVAYPDPIAVSGNWAISLRSVSDAKDVSVIARGLGGGGHKPAAGARIKAKTASEALMMVEKQIEQMS